jgi:hypothetical protein
LYCTVKRMLNPGPWSKPARANNRCASKNFAGLSTRSSNRSRPVRTSAERRRAESA